MTFSKGAKLQETVRGLGWWLVAGAEVSGVHIRVGRRLCPSLRSARCAHVRASAGVPCVCLHPVCPCVPPPVLLACLLPMCPCVPPPSVPACVPPPGVLQACLPQLCPHACLRPVCPCTGSLACPAALCCLSGRVALQPP